MRKMISLDEAADRLGCSKRTVRRLIADGSLKGYRLGKTHTIRIDVNEMEHALSPVVPNGKR